MAPEIRRRHVASMVVRLRTVIVLRGQSIRFDASDSNRSLIMRITTTTLLPAVVFLSIAGCGERATLPVKDGMGPHPTLPPPNHTMLPTINIAPARGWPVGTTPTPAAGLAVAAYANGLDHPRWLYVLPNGDA